MDKRHQEAVARYDKVNTVPLYMKLNRKTDADILAKLESVGNKQGYVKFLIRRDMRDAEAGQRSEVGG